MGRGIIAVIFFLAFLAGAHAATFGCEIRTSCLSNQTLLVRLNSSETGQVPNNSHAQLANYSGVAYPYSVCCWTDSFRVLDNSCQGNGYGVLHLNSTSDSHVEAGNMSTAIYPYKACLNVTAGNVSCTYENSCSAGTAVLSIASSEAGAANLTNAHVASAGYYTKKVCCEIGAQNPPYILWVNITPAPNATTQNDLECQNGTTGDVDGDTVTLHYNWYRNGTSITLLNLPMDYPDGIQTSDISGRGGHANLRNVTFQPTGGKYGGGYLFNGVYSSCCTDQAWSSRLLVPTDSAHNFLTTSNFSISFWLSTRNNPQQQGIMSRRDADANSGWAVFLTSRRINFESASSKTSTGTIDQNNTWYHVVITQNATTMAFYIDGASAGSGSNAGINSLVSSAMDVGRVFEPFAGFDYFYEFNGSLDEVMIFNRTLTSAEVQTLYAMGNRHLNRSEIRRGDAWNCSITPIDSTGLNGSTVRSNQTNFSGSTPLPVNLTYPANGNLSVFERFVNFTWTTATEYDGDQVNYTLHVVVTPGACAVQTALTNLQTTNRTVGELCVDQPYNWTVEACDVDGCSGNTTLFNFTIASVLDITLANNNTNFRDLANGQTKSTDDYNVTPFLVRNDGNVLANVSIAGNNSPFTSVGLGDTAFQFKAADNESGSINTSGSQTSYTPITSAFLNAVRQLNYSDASDTAAVHINVTVPTNEPPGAKRGNVTFQGVAS